MHALIQNICQSDRKCRDMLRMSPIAYQVLCCTIKSKSKVKDYACVTVEEQLITFLLVLGQKFKNRVVGCFFCRSGETISSFFHNILVALITWEDEFVKQPTSYGVHEKILHSRQFVSLF